MRIVDLALIYGGVGVGWALSLLPRRGSARDLPWILLVWPIYGPLQWRRKEEVEEDAADMTRCFPREEARRFTARLRAARSRLAEADALLATPALREGSGASAAVAARLRGWEEGLARALAEIDELRA